MVFKLIPDGFSAETREEIHAQFDDDLIEGMIFFFHFLVMAAALFCFSSLYEIGHTFEDFISSSEILVNKMFVMKF